MQAGGFLGLVIEGDREKLLKGYGVLFGGIEMVGNWIDG